VVRPTATPIAMICFGATVMAREPSCDSYKSEHRSNVMGACKSYLDRLSSTPWPVWMFLYRKEVNNSASAFKTILFAGSDLDWFG